MAIQIQLPAKPATSGYSRYCVAFTDPMAAAIRLAIRAPGAPFETEADFIRWCVQEGIRLLNE